MQKQLRPRHLLKRNFSANWSRENENFLQSCAQTSPGSINRRELFETILAVSALSQVRSSAQPKRGTHFQSVDIGYPCGYLG
jgi:hypothetical protein